MTRTRETGPVIFGGFASIFCRSASRGTSVTSIEGRVIDAATG